MSNEGTRLAVVEEKVSTLHDTIHGEDGLGKRLREVEKTVYKAVGMGVVINAVVFLVFEFIKK